MPKGFSKRRRRDPMRRIAVSMTPEMIAEIELIQAKHDLTFSECARRLIIKGILAHYVPIEDKEKKNDKAVN